MKAQAIDFPAYIQQMGATLEQYGDGVAETYQRPTRKELAALPHPEWIPGQGRDLCRVYNGLLYPWTSKPGSTARPCRGRLNLQRLQDIYADWEGIVYMRGWEDPDELPLHDFKIVDLFTDEAGVGLYHTAAQNPELYLYVFQEYGPLPLGLDLAGYIQLLPYSLAHNHWPYLLVELAEHFATQPDQPFRGPYRPAAKIFVNDLVALTEFQLADFAVLYGQVRLRR